MSFFLGSFFESVISVLRFVSTWRVDCFILGFVGLGVFVMFEFFLFIFESLEFDFYLVFRNY